MHRVKKGFTLVELLVVISIIALLLAVLMPALNKAREQGRMVVCKANLKSTGTGIYLYAQDNKDIIVSACSAQYAGYDATFDVLLDKYLKTMRPSITDPYKGAMKPAKSAGLWSCPSDKEKRDGDPRGPYGRWPALIRSYTMNFMVSTYYAPSQGIYGFSARTSRVPSRVAIVGEHWDKYNILRCNTRSANYFYKLWDTCPSIYGMEWTYTHPHKMLNFLCMDLSSQSYVYKRVAADAALGGSTTYWDATPAR